MLRHITVGVNRISGFHHDLAVVDEKRAEGLVSPISSFDRELYRPTKEAGVGFRGFHEASLSESDWCSA